MTILFICNEYPPGRIGGIGSMTRTLARALVSQGHTVLVAGLYLPGYGGADLETDQGVRIWRRRLMTDIGILKNTYSFIDLAISKFLTRSGILRKDMETSIGKFNRFLARLVREHNVDIVEWPDFNDWFQFIRRPVQWPALDVPLLIKFNGTQTFLNPPGHQLTNPTLYQQELQHIRRATALAAVSRHTAESYKKLYDLDKPVSILYNSVELPPLDYNAGVVQKKIIFTGSLTHRKGLLSLVKAWNYVYQKHPDAVLEIYGKGKMNPFISAALPDARASIHYMGFKQKKEFYASMRTASASIFPSYSECFAFAPLEAMAAGCPVINTERYSGPELVSHDINGLLIDPDDAVQMADAMNALLESESLRSRFSINGRNTVEEKFSIGKSVNDHLALYTKVISGYQANGVMHRDVPDHRRVASLALPHDPA